MFDNLNRLLPGFSIFENTEKISIHHAQDKAGELEIKIKKNFGSYSLFAIHRGYAMFFTSVLDSNEATVGAYFLVNKYLECHPKPLHKRIEKNILYYHKELSKKMSCPPSLETVHDLYMEIWELL